MAEEIEIRNVGGSNGVASEATLQRLVAAMNAMAKAQGNSSDQAAKAQKAFERSIRSSTNSVSANEDAFDDNTSAVRRNTSMVGGLIGALGNLIGGTIGEVTGSMVGLSRELLVGGNRIGDFARHLPFLGDTFGMIGGFLDGQIDMYRDLSGTGVNFNNSLIDMNRAAIASNMSMSMFAEAVGSNSTRMALFGENVAGGASAFGNLSRRMRDGRIGEQLFNMGFTMSDINDGLIAYTTQQARLGKLEGMSQQQLIAGSQNYLTEIDRLARVTGMNRKELEQERLARAQEANMMVMRNRLLGDTEALANFDASMDAAASMGPEFALMIKDLADGVAQTDIGKRFASISDDMLPLAMAIGRGEIGVEEFQRRMGPVADELNNFATGLGSAGIQGTEGLAGMAGLFGSLFQINEFVSKTFNEAEAQKAQERRDALTSLGTNFEQTISTLRTTLLDKLINNQTFENIETLLNDTFEEGAMDTFTTNIANFMEEFTQDPKGKIQEIFSNAYNGFLDFLLGPVENEAGDRAGGFAEQMYNSIKDTIIPYAKDLFGTMGNSLMDFLFGPMEAESQERTGGFAEKMMESIRTNVIPMFEDLMTTLGDLFMQHIPRIIDNVIGSITGEGAAEPLANKESLTNEEAATVLNDITGTGLFNSSEMGSMFAGLESVDDFGGQDLVNRVFEASGLGWMSQTNPFSSNRNVGDMQRALEELFRLSGSEQGLTPEQTAIVQEFNRAIRNGDNSFSQGTQGFRNFGSGTLALLHGTEAVVPRNSPEGQMLANAQSGRMPMSQGSQEGVVVAINQLNSTMSQAASMLAEIKALNKRQLTATREMGAVY